MKVIHVNFADTRGGAARAAYRLHLSLLKRSAQSSMLVLRKHSGDSTVIGPKGPLKKILSKFRSRFEFLLTRLKAGKTSGMFSPGLISGPEIIVQITSSDSDVLNLHWTCQAMLRIEDLRLITKPIVWTLHDLWPLTGGCHADEGCEQYQSGCGNCPIISNRGEFDLSREVLFRKKASYTDLDITIVAPSRWMAEKARKSSLFRGRKIHVIHNGLDLEKFRPIDTEFARRSLGLPIDKQLVLFGAMNSTDNPGKGFDLLLEGLTHLPKDTCDNVDLAVFGSSGSGDVEKTGFAAHFMGDIYDDEKLAELYAAADVTIVPSRQDNLPNIVSESLACGTPVVAFDIGGIPEMFEHEVSGYLAKAFDPVDLAHGLEYVLGRQRMNNLMSDAARKSAIDNFSDKAMSLKYLSLYDSIGH